MKVAIFARVSTDKQNTDSQIQELLAFASKQGWTVTHKITETISGATKTKDRPQLQELIELAKKQQFQKVLIWEVSRLGRNTAEVLSLVNLLTDLGISVYVKRLFAETLNPDGSENVTGKLIIGLLSQIAEMEKATIKDRIKRGLEKAKRDGKQIGRPKGSKQDDEAILKKHPKVVRRLKLGQSNYRISKDLSKSMKLIKKVKLILEKQEALKFVA